MKEFEELQQIWNSQNDRPLYVLDEEALHRRVMTKKKKASHVAQFSELLLIVVNIVSGSIVLTMNFSMTTTNTFMYLLAAWMYVTALYCLWSRLKRVRGSKQFERSLHGDLDHAVAIATYQVRLSQLTRWNAVPVGVLILLGMWEGNKPIWMALGLLVFIGLVFYLGGWEHGIYESRKRELEILRSKLKKTGE